MSRIAKNPISIPSGTTVEIKGSTIVVTGPQGSLSMDIYTGIKLEVLDGKIICSVQGSSSNLIAMSGTTRALVSNMVEGCNKGFTIKLILKGTGYRAQLKDNLLNLSLGYSHPVVYTVPSIVKAKIVNNTEINLFSIDKHRLGQTAAEIRAYRKVEPYKGKGISYSDEVVVLKEVKKK